MKVIHSVPQTGSRLIEIGYSTENPETLSVRSRDWKDCDGAESKTTSELSADDLLYLTTTAAGFDFFSQKQKMEMLNELIETLSPEDKVDFAEDLVHELVRSGRDEHE